MHLQLPAILIDWLKWNLHKAYSTRGEMTLRRDIISASGACPLYPYPSVSDLTRGKVVITREKGVGGRSHQCSRVQERLIWFEHAMCDDFKFQVAVVLLRRPNVPGTESGTNQPCFD